MYFDILSDILLRSFINYDKPLEFGPEKTLKYNSQKLNILIFKKLFYFFTYKDFRLKYKLFIMLNETKTTFFAPSS